MGVIPRLRMVMGSRPWIYWLCASVIALIITASMRCTQAEVQRARDRWGTTSAVLVASRNIAPGERLDGAVIQRELPRAMVAAMALDVLPTGATARQRIAAGEIVVGLDVATRAGPLALLPAGWLAVAVPDQRSELFAVGDAAVVLSGGETISDSAIVVGVIENDVLVGVPQTTAAAVADAVNQHTAVVALSANLRQ